MMAARVEALMPQHLSTWAMYSGLLAAAGLPIYIHAPKFYVDEYGVGLGALGVALFALRLVDVVQDPILGWLVERTPERRSLMTGIAAALMAAAMVALFAVPPPIAPILWFAATLLVLFTAYSFLTIAFYAEGVAKALRMGSAGYLRLAGWREGGALAGVCLAAVAPTVLALLTDQPFAAFALGFAAVALLVAVAMNDQWRNRAEAGAGPPGGALRKVLSDPFSRRLLLLALVNATPVAITSTLFLFFVESRLGAPGAEGPLLLLFFLAAALSTPLWMRAALRLGPKRALLLGMALAILSFAGAATLGAGDVLPFALICVASGAALGADLTLLPAIFARRMQDVSPGAGAGFGLWSFVSKLTLAFAAVGLLPLLEARGFVSGGPNTEAALWLLTFLYALVPCVLKLVAMALLAATQIPEA